MPVLDTFERPLANLRLSVTDRCNLRCSYCMPEENYRWLPKPSVLTFEEIALVVDAFIQVGVAKVRITGGEPLVRRDLDQLIAMLAAKPALADIALTTNGLLLADAARALFDAGLGRITVSLDTLKAETFRSLTRRDGLEQVLAGIAAVRALGARELKLDTVMIQGVNDGELFDLLDYARSVGAEIRFIEYMDVGGATRWSMEDVVTREEMLERIAARYGGVEPLREPSSAPAERFRLADGTVFGIIASTTAPFCRSCDRSRLTADGMWYRCLYAVAGTDLRAAVRGGATRDELAELLAATWRTRTDRGAEERAALHARSSFVPVSELKRDPHLEMHTRGG